METIYLLVLEIITVGIVYHYLSFYFSIFLASIFVGINICIRGKQGAIISLFLIIFLLNSVRTISYSQLQIGENTEIKTELKLGFGKIQSIDRKYPKENLYVSMDKIPDGKVEMKGEVIKISRDRYGRIVYRINPMEYKEIEDNKIKVYLENRVEWLTENYSRKLKNMYKAILLGDSQALDLEIKNKFKYLGISHLLVISGLHLSIIIATIVYILKKLPIKREFEIGGGIIFLTIYVVGLGATPSILRAYIMAVIYLLGKIVYEKSDSKKSLALAYVFTLLIYPNWFTNISFVLSYVAVFAILFVYPYIPKLKNFKSKYIKYLYKNITLILTIQLLMTPIFIYNFKSFPVLAFIPNFFLVPIGSLLITTAFVSLLLSNIYIGIFLMPGVNLIFNIFLFCVDIFSKLPYLTLEI